MKKSIKKQSHATISDVARQAGAGKTSVSRYLNGELGLLSEDLRTRIGAAIKALDYRPSQSARALKAGRSRLIGLVLADITNPYSISVLRGVERVCNEAGYMLMVCNTNNEPEQQNRYLALLSSHRVDGVIINSVGMSDESLGAFADIDCPFVFVDRKGAGIECDVVGLDNRQAMNIAARHLVEQGYESILFLTQSLAIDTRLERLRALQEYVGEVAGMSCDFFELTRDEQSLEQAITDFVASHRGLKKAIVTGNGVVTMSTAKALKRLRIDWGAQIGLLSVDDPDWAELPGSGITSVRQPSLLIGETACRILLRRIEGDSDAPRHHRYPAELVIRGSTGM
ncbi:LacI family DNA-binding transcriptional regulator [Zobellella sp. An-6]|uniref:LacI family DNA-binding transcriptional regulator n=1 Tax=Zobellella sp. An-6 TaxID=3400218 RepID=UPI0040423D5E